MIKGTSAGGVVINSQNQVAIVNQRWTSWSLPKGHIDPGEELLETAKREVHEETGITDLEYVRALGSYERTGRIRDADGLFERGLKTIHIFLFRSNQKYLKPIDPDNPEARWVSKEEAMKMLSFDGDKEMVKKAMDSGIEDGY